ncbi:MAG: ester cyclase [Nevskia sp.]|nr:ester cyclase [Nevskia sp.]
MTQAKAVTVPPKADPGMSPEEMKAFVRRHFEDFINRKDSNAALRNFTPDILDHDEPYGAANGNEILKTMIEGIYAKWPDIHVTVEDAVSERDMVIVRNHWRFTDPATGKPMEFQGFVQWRFAKGKICERWATLTQPTEVAAESGWR